MSRYLTPLYYFLAFLVHQQNAVNYTKIDPLVDTKVGLIRGLRASDGTYSMFLGIPFGKVNFKNPFGNIKITFTPSVQNSANILKSKEKWAAATSYPPFDKVFEAYNDSVFCPQIEEFNNTAVGSLDCLQLNIYVPTTASQKRLPVLVWVHGGGFIQGNAGRIKFGPKYLVTNEIILVSVNYRLGPYGFLCLDTPEVPGNQGLKDQLLALRWIKNNIESFGGDVGQITIMGESAGGLSVGLHLQSKHENLFQKAIVQSGPVLLSGWVRGADTTAPLKLSEQLGFITTDMNEALNYLTTVDPHLVIAAASKSVHLSPCVEKEFKNVEAFVSEYPVNSKVPKVKEIPVLLGFNAEEWLSFHSVHSPDYYETNDIIKNRLVTCFDFDQNTLGEMEEIIRHFYIGDEEPRYDVRLKLAEFDSDFLIGHPTERSIDMYFENEATSIYYYVFSYVGERNYYRWERNLTIDSKAIHGDELGYLFDVSFWTGEPSVKDQLIIDRITLMWTNFAKYGDPTPETTELLPIKWKPITSKDSPRYYLNIDSEMVLGKRPFHDRFAFWDLFYRKSEEFQKGYVTRK